MAYTHGNRKIYNIEKLIGVTLETGEKVKTKATGFRANFKEFPLATTL